MKPLQKMTIKKPMDRPDVHTVWVGAEDRVASFHAVDRYELRTFDCYDAFINYLYALQLHGFRFQ